MRIDYTRTPSGEIKGSICLPDEKICDSDFSEVEPEQYYISIHMKYKFFFSYLCLPTELCIPNPTAWQVKPDEKQ